MKARDIRPDVQAAMRELEAANQDLIFHIRPTAAGFLLLTREARFPCASVDDLAKALTLLLIRQKFLT